MPTAFASKLNREIALRFVDGAVEEPARADKRKTPVIDKTAVQPVENIIDELPCKQISGERCDAVVAPTGCGAVVIGGAPFVQSTRGLGAAEEEWCRSRRGT